MKIKDFIFDLDFSFSYIPVNRYLSFFFYVIVFKTIIQQGNVENFVVLYK